MQFCPKFLSKNKFSIHKVSPFLSFRHFGIDFIAFSFIKIHFPELSFIWVPHKRKPNPMVIKNINLLFLAIFPKNVRTKQLFSVLQKFSSIRISNWIRIHVQQTNWCYPSFVTVSFYYFWSGVLFAQYIRKLEIL